MSQQLSVHEKAAIGAMFAKHFGRELTMFPELVKAEEWDIPPEGPQAFNRDFALSFTSKSLKDVNIKSVVCNVLPNHFGPDLFLTVEPATLDLLLIQTIGLPAAPLSFYGQYITVVQSWLHQCIAKAAGLWTHGMSDDAWGRLGGCVSDFARFDMLRLMIIGDRMCFFGQIGNVVSVREMGDVMTFDETGRHLSIRAAEGRAFAIDGFTSVPVARTQDATFWIQE